MAGRNPKPNSGGFDASEKVNSNTLKRHPKMDLSRNDLLQLLSYLEGELQARDIAIATLKAEKAKQLLYQAKYGRFGLGDPFSAMQRDSDNMKDHTFDESAIKSMYDNQLAQLENLIATQRKAQMKMREQMLAGDKRYQKVCSELDDEKRKHAQDTAQGDDVTYMLEKERERLKQEVDFEKVNVKKMEKDMKKTLASLEDERASSAKHKQVALMLIKERKKLVEKYIQEKYKADQAEKTLQDERNKSMNMAEGLVQESKKSLKMEATMERQASEFDLEREQLRNKLQREENRNKDLAAQVESLAWQMENLQKQKPFSKEPVHTVEIKSTVQSPSIRLSGEKSPWISTSPTTILTTKPSGNIVEREAGLSPRNTSAELTVRKRDNTRYASPQAVPIERGHVQYGDSSLEQRVAPVGAVADNKVILDSGTGHKLNVSLGGPTVLSSGGRITVQTTSPTTSAGPISPRRMLSVNRGTPPPIPPNKPILPVTTTTSVSKPVSTQKVTTMKDGRPPGSKPVHIPVSVVHTTTVSASPSTRSTKHEGSPSSLRKPAQLSEGLYPTSDNMHDDNLTPPTSESFDFLGQEMADLQQLLVSMVSVPSDSSRVANGRSCSTSRSTSDVAVSPSMTSSMTSSLTSSVPGVTSQMTSSTSTLTSQMTSLALTSSTLDVSSQMASSTEKSVINSSSLNMTSPLTSHLSISPSTSQKYLSLPSQTTSSSTTSFTSHIPLPESSDMFPSNTNFIYVTSPLTSATLPSAFVSPNNSWYTIGSVPEKVSSTVSLSASLPTAISASMFGAPVSGISVRGSLDSTNVGVHTQLPHKTSSVSDLPTSPIHRYAAMGTVDALRKLIVDLEADVNLPMKDGTTPAHCAAENGHEGCLRLLLERKCHINCLRDDQQTPLHCAAASGHTGCVRYLLEQGASSDLSDHAGWTPLHWAAFKGHIDCCRVLLHFGAKRLVQSNTNWTPIHLAVHANWPDCVDLLLTFESSQSESLFEVRNVGQVLDKDSMTLTHIAAMKESPDCLTVICNHCDIDVRQVDKWGRSALDVSSSSCRHILQPYAISSHIKHVTVQMQCSGPLYTHQEPFVIGQIEMVPSMHWGYMTSSLVDCAEGYFHQLDRGLRTKKVARLDPENTTDDGQYTLGFSYDSICAFKLGNVTWNSTVESHPGVKLPVVLANVQKPVVTIYLKGSSTDSDSLAFDLLLPVVFCQCFTRLMEQHKCVIFYGPEGTRKKQLVKRLAKHMAEKERVAGIEPRISQLYLHRDFKHRDFVHFLKTEGCLLPVGNESECSCIVVLYNLEKVQFADMLGGLTQHIEHRGGHHSFCVPAYDGTQELCYFPDNFYLIATMDKPRSTGLDLSLQQRFRWVHFPVKNEPIRNLLGRHLLRRLLHTYKGVMPPAEDTVFKVVEWILCVWQRLNDGVSKLGLPDVVFGPDIFMPCPLESHNSQVILDWLKCLWNESISPVVKSGVMKGTGKDNGEHKVANTALFVLMQRVIVPGCPLNGKEKEDYLLGYCGSNELDVPLKNDKWSPASQPVTIQRRPLHNGHHDNRGSWSNNRKSTGSAGPPRYMPNNNNNTFKRRSHSDNSLTQTDRIEIPVIHHQGGEQSSDVQAKVPKLEIRSPVLGLPIPIPNNFSNNEGNDPLNTMSSSSNHRGNNISSSQRRSTFSSHSRIPQPSKRSRSSENLSSPHLLAVNRGQGHSQGQFQPTSPFSFSLTTPNSSLFSFKTYNKSHHGNVSSKSRSLTSSPTSLLYPSASKR